MISLDAATVLLQWAAGAMIGAWLTTRHDDVGRGYGQLVRLVFGFVALGSLATARWSDSSWARTLGATAVATLCGAALVIAQRRGARPEGRAKAAQLDVLAGLVGLVALVAAGLELSVGGLAIARWCVGAVFLGVVTDAMLLGHWYLVQPGMPRSLLGELVGAVSVVWPLEVAVLLVPRGMGSVLSGAIDDGWGGTLGWMWAACALSTIALCVVTRLALRERGYSAVMAATGLLYLAILTAFGTDLIARAVLA